MGGGGCGEMGVWSWLFPSLQKTTLGYVRTLGCFFFQLKLRFFLILKRASEPNVSLFLFLCVVLLCSSGLKLTMMPQYP